MQDRLARFLSPKAFSTTTHTCLPIKTRNTKGPPHPVPAFAEHRVILYKGTQSCIGLLTRS